MAPYFPPEINRRYAREIDRQLRLAQSRSAFSAFTHLTRWELDPDDAAGSHGSLAATFRPSSGLMPAVHVRRNAHGAGKVLGVQLSGATAWGATANNADVAHVIHHEVGHVVVDDYAHWNPKGPFPLLDVYCGIVGLPAGSYEDLAAAISNYEPRLQAAFSEYGYSTMATRWQTAETELDQSNETTWNTFYGFEAFAGSPESDAALARWQTYSVGEQRTIARILWALTEAATDATATWLQNKSLVDDPFAQALGGMYEALPAELADGRDRRRTTLNYWASSVLKQSDLWDLARVDRSLGQYAFTSRDRSLDFERLSGDSAPHESAYMESTYARRTRPSSAEPSANTDDVPQERDIDSFEPLLPGDSRSPGRPYWLIEFDESGNLSGARFEIDGAAVEPMIPMTGMDSFTGLPVMSLAGFDAKPRPGQVADSATLEVESGTSGTHRTPDAKNPLTREIVAAVARRSSNYMSAVIVANAIGSSTPSHTESLLTLAESLNEAPGSRFFVTQDAALALAEAQLPEIRADEVAYWGTFLDLDLTDIDGSKQLLTTCLRTRDQIYLVDSTVATNEDLADVIAATRVKSMVLGAQLSTKSHAQVDLFTISTVPMGKLAELTASLEDGHCSLPLAPLAGFAERTGLETSPLGPLAVVTDAPRIDAARDLIIDAALRHVEAATQRAVTESAEGYLDALLLDVDPNPPDQPNPRAIAVCAAIVNDPGHIANVGKDAGITAWEEIRPLIAEFQPELRNHVASHARTYLNSLAPRALELKQGLDELAEHIRRTLASKSEEHETQVDEVSDRVEALIRANRTTDHNRDPRDPSDTVRQLERLSAIPGARTIGTLPPLPPGADVPTPEVEAPAVQRMEGPAQAPPAVRVTEPTIRPSFGVDAPGITPTSRADITTTRQVDAPGRSHRARPAFDLG